MLKKLIIVSALVLGFTGSVTMGKGGDSAGNAPATKSAVGTISSMKVGLVAPVEACMCSPLDSFCTPGC